MNAKNIDLLRKALQRIDDSTEYNRQARRIISEVLADEVSRRE